MVATDEEEELKPLGVTCTSTDCENDLHCFLQKKRKERGTLRRGGPCRDCGVDLIQWDRVSKRNVRDAEYTFDALRNEMIRHVFWHSTFTVQELNHAMRKGRMMLTSAIRQRLEVSVGREQHPREGRQTPFEGNVIYHAQHAVAACCRKCIEYWHAIPAGRKLSDNELSYLSQLVGLYVDARLPDLPKEPRKIPVQRRVSAVAE